MVLSKKQQKYLKNTIKHEEIHRKGLERENDIWCPRLMLKELGGIATGSCYITNAGGVKGKTLNLDDISLEKIQRLVKDLESGINSSRWKEKFMRYAHNNDKVNATKYHEKLNEWFVEADAKIREISEAGGSSAFSIDNRVNDKDFSYKQGDEGFMEFSKEMKKAYEWRTQILECI